eukprot:CAMPEP_0183708906 /NCGR_PEP_ID=MMETSP0737-20130205/5070_1 /TAXON_ID=385413 /ORGANISM="Thalassiosira miniscula, Strain CCMP1093" /LENGTH=1326 /DNA_ID=CAMNT_0025936863 /DNA_START=200 /DNA_END=4177 /DNA_ORIENTATION=+
MSTNLSSSEDNGIDRDVERGDDANDDGSGASSSSLQVGRRGLVHNRNHGSNINVDSGASAIPSTDGMNRAADDNDATTALPTFQPLTGPAPDGASNRVPPDSLDSVGGRAALLAEPNDYDNRKSPPQGVAPRKSDLISDTARPLSNQRGGVAAMLLPPSQPSASASLGGASMTDVASNTARPLSNQALSEARGAPLGGPKNDANDLLESKIQAKISSNSNNARRSNNQDQASSSTVTRQERIDDDGAEPINPLSPLSQMTMGQPKNEEDYLESRIRAKVISSNSTNARQHNDATRNNAARPLPNQQASSTMTSGPELIDDGAIPALLPVQPNNNNDDMESESRIQAKIHNERRRKDLKDSLMDADQLSGSVLPSPLAGNNDEGDELELSIQEKIKATHNELKSSLMDVDQLSDSLQHSWGHSMSSLPSAAVVNNDGGNDDIEMNIRKKINATHNELKSSLMDVDQLCDDNSLQQDADSIGESWQLQHIVEGENERDSKDESVKKRNHLHNNNSLSTTSPNELPLPSPPIHPALLAEEGQYKNHSLPVSEQIRQSEQIRPSIDSSKTSNDGVDNSQTRRSTVTNEGNETMGSYHQDGEIHIPIAWKVGESDDSDNNEDDDSEAVLTNDRTNLTDGDEEEVIIATPMEDTPPPIPWRKQRRTKILLCAALAIMAALVITLSLEFTKKETVVTVKLTASPSVSFVPTMVPTTAFPSVEPSYFPSISWAPSSSPSQCIVQISSQIQRVPLEFLGTTFFEAANDPLVVIDGDAMAVVISNSKSQNLYTVFFSLKEEKEEDGRSWTMAQEPIEDLLAFSAQYSVAISGPTAMVGIDLANGMDGVVNIYKQGPDGHWDKMKSLDGDPYALLGRSVDIDGDLACVGDMNHITLFRENVDDGDWVKVHKFYYADKCSISGDTIAIDVDDLMEGYLLKLYHYHRDSNEVLELQDPIRPGHITSMALNRDYLAYWDGSFDNDCPEYVVTYRRDDEKNGTFSPHHEFHFSGGPTHNCVGRETYQSSPLALSGDVMMVSRGNQTYVYSDGGGIWEETLTLDQSYDLLQLSGRRALATIGSELYSFDLEPCTQAVPTQLPSSSMAPTACYTIQIDVVYDDHPGQVSWQLQRDGRVGEVLSMYEESNPNATSYSSSMCLPKGRYQFGIYDSLSDGICCWRGNGHYNVTTANGDVIAAGGDYRYADETKFSLPFILPPPSAAPTVSSLPTMSPYPTVSASPTTSPSASAQPTAASTQYPTRKTILPPELTLPPGTTPWPTYDPTAGDVTLTSAQKGDSSTAVPLPTMTPSSMLHSSSPHPTTCYDINLAITYNPEKPEGTSW